MYSTRARARATARAKARVKAKARAKSPFPLRKWAWWIAALTFIIWAVGNFVPDPYINSKYIIVTPTMEPVPGIRPKKTVSAIEGFGSPATSAPFPTPVPTVKRFSEAQRRDIFRLMIEAENQAQKVADAAFPTDADTTDLMSDANFRANMEANNQLADKLMSEYKSKIYKKFRLSKKEQHLIGNEGMLKHWPPL